MSVLLIILALGLLFLLTYFLVPALTLKYRFRSNLHEGLLSEDFTHYLPDAQSQEYITGYQLLFRQTDGRRYLRVDYAKGHHELTYLLVLFDAGHRPYAVRKVHENDTMVSLSRLFQADKKTYGALLVLLEADGRKTDNQKPMILETSQLVKASILEGLFTLLCLVLFLYGLSGFTREGLSFSFFTYFKPVTTFLLLLGVFLLSSILSYVFLYLINRPVLKAKKEESKHE